MNTEIAVSIITAIATIISVVISTKRSAKKQSDDIAQKLELAQAITDTKIEELTREVREHNNFARRLPVVESEIQHINKEIDELKRKE